MNSNQWRSVTEPQWPDNAIVALIEWLPNLTKTTMPSVLRQHLAGNSKYPNDPIDMTSMGLKSLDESQLQHLVQWSDLIIFDYLTGNYDRVASMQV